MVYFNVNIYHYINSFVFCFFLLFIKTRFIILYLVQIFIYLCFYLKCCGYYQSNPDQITVLLDQARYLCICIMYIYLSRYLECCYYQELVLTIQQSFQTNQTYYEFIPPNYAFVHLYIQVSRMLLLSGASPDYTTELLD